MNLKFSQCWGDPDLYEPACANSKLVAKLLNKDKLTPEEINIVLDLTFDITISGEPHVVTRDFKNHSHIATYYSRDKKIYCGLMKTDEGYLSNDEVIKGRNEQEVHSKYYDINQKKNKKLQDKEDYERAIRVRKQLIQEEKDIRKGKTQEC